MILSDNVSVRPGPGRQRYVTDVRVTVRMIVGAMSAGRTIEQLLADFPYIEEADIREALTFAASLAQGRDLTRKLMRLLADMNLTPRWV